MMKRNSVFIAMSLDGYIADKKGGIDWLHKIPNPQNEDMGYTEFSENIDALVMGRTTFETVCGFDMDWPYSQPVFVLSNTLQEIPDSYREKVFLIKGPLAEIQKQLHQKGHHRLYIDGGTTIQGFIQEDLIDEMTITTFPILLGSGHTLFGELPEGVEFELLTSKVYLNQLVQSRYRRKR